MSVVLLTCSISFKKNLFQATEFFAFAGLMLVTTVVFAIMAYYYKYIQTPPDFEGMGLDSQGLVTDDDPATFDKRSQSADKLQLSLLITRYAAGIQVESPLQPLDGVFQTLHLRVDPDTRTAITGADEMHVAVPIAGRIDSVPGRQQ